MALDASQTLIIDILTRFFSIFSIIACLLVIFGYFYFPPFHNSISSRLALAIALADLLSISSQALGRLGPQYGDPLCMTQAVFQQFGELVSIFIITGIALNLVLVLVYDYEFDAIKQLDPYHVMVSIVLAAVFTLIPLVIQVDGKSVYGDSGLWCWFRLPAYRWFLYGPLFCCILVCMGVYIYVTIDIKKKAAEDALFMGISVDDPYVNTLPSTVAMYLAVFLVTWLPMAVIQIVRIFTPGGSIMMLDVVLVVCLPLRGLADAGVALYQAYKGRRMNNKMQRLGLNSDPMAKQEWWVELDARLLSLAGQ